ncbi:MAG: 4Fe-4S binding protein [Elusimicrobia bacterium]|nr:4Fe-4S binding protein [Elusimicrobiota bacterium]
METPAVVKKPKSKLIASISADLCSGCEACLSVMPHPDCIVKLDSHPSVPFGMVVVGVQDEKCTGCTLCMRICPWEAIQMVPRPPSPLSVIPAKAGI